MNDLQEKNLHIFSFFFLAPINVFINVFIFRFTSLFRHKIDKYHLWNATLLFRSCENIFCKLLHCKYIQDGNRLWNVTLILRCRWYILLPLCFFSEISFMLNVTLLLRFGYINVVNCYLSFLFLYIICEIYLYLSFQIDIFCTQLAWYIDQKRYFNWIFTSVFRSRHILFCEI